MEMNYSQEWLELVRKREEFERASFSFNNYVEENQRKEDLRNALKVKDVLKQEHVLEMMAQGYIFTDSVELVLEEIVEIAVTGHEDCVAQAWPVLENLNRRHRNDKKWKEKVIELIYFYTDKNKHDEAVFHFAWLLLYELRFKHALKEYIEKYKEYMEGEFDDEILSDIENMEDD